jgi:hypothetical protein
MYLPYFKRKVVFYNQKVEKLVKSMGFVVGSKIHPKFLNNLANGFHTDDQRQELGIHPKPLNLNQINRCIYHL